MHWEPDVGFDPGSPGSRPGPKAGAKPQRHPGIPQNSVLKKSDPFPQEDPFTGEAGPSNFENA